MDQLHGRSLGSDGDNQVLDESQEQQWFVGRQQWRTSSSVVLLGVPSHDFQVEKPRFGLHWLCLAITLLKELFWERGLSPGWKPKIFDRATTMLVHCSLLEGVAFVELLCFLDVVFGGGMSSTVGRSRSLWWDLFFYFFSFFLWLCASWMSCDIL